MDPHPDPDPAIFVTELQDGNQKLIYQKNFVCELLLEGTFTSFFKDKQAKKRHKTVEINVFLSIFA